MVRTRDALSACKISLWSKLGLAYASPFLGGISVDKPMLASGASEHSIAGGC